VALARCEKGFNNVTFGDDVDGIGGKAGMRVAW
jgi:hypothetical protein